MKGSINGVDQLIVDKVKDRYTALGPHSNSKDLRLQYQQQRAHPMATYTLICMAYVQ